MMAIFTRLFGRQDRQQGFIEAQRKVLDYARYLEACPPMLGRIIDVSKLPHDKQMLKSALLMCISHSNDERLEEHLKAGYLMLSAFQPHVGERDIGTDFAALDLEQDPLDIATQIEQEEELAGGWRHRVQDELEQLKDDLMALELQLAEPARLSA